MSSEEGISKADIVEIKSLSSPPEVVVKVCGAYGLMIGIGSDWATMKKHFGNMDCLEGMKRIDQSPLEEIPIERQKKAKKMLRGLTYQEVAKVSKAASGLFVFVSLKIGNTRLFGPIHRRRSYSLIHSICDMFCFCYSVELV